MKNCPQCGSDERTVRLCGGGLGSMCEQNHTDCDHAWHTSEDILRPLAVLVDQIRKSNAVDDHGHAIIHLKALADAEQVLRNYGY